MNIRGRSTTLGGALARSMDCLQQREREACHQGGRYRQRYLLNIMTQATDTDIQQIKDLIVAGNTATQKQIADLAISTQKQISDLAASNQKQIAKLDKKNDRVMFRSHVLSPIVQITEFQSYRYLHSVR
jgi:uncharacterized protein YegL